MSSLNMAAIMYDELTDLSIPSEEQVYNFIEDPLLISCTLHRLIKENTDSYNEYMTWSLDGYKDTILSKTIDQDRIFAETIRSYYRAKLLIAKLRNEQLTKYKTDLLRYLTDSPTQLTRKFVGMVYKLPYFYEYDMQLIEIFGGEYSLVSRSFKDKTDISLSFISKADNGQKSCRKYEYWFKDQTDTRFLIEVEKNNPISKLWEQTIQQGEINISAFFEKKRRDNLEFYCAKWWSINV